MDANRINIIAASAGSRSALLLVFIFAAFLKRGEEKYNKYLVPVPSHESEHDGGGAYGTIPLYKHSDSDGNSTKSPDSIKRKIAPMDTQPCYDTTHLPNQNEAFNELPPASEILNNFELTDIKAAPAIVDAELDQIKEGKHVSFLVKIDSTHEIPFKDDAYKGDDDDVSLPKKGDGSVSTCTLTAPMDRDEESFELKSMDIILILKYFHYNYFRFCKIVVTSSSHVWNIHNSSSNLKPSIFDQSGPSGTDTF